MDVREEGAISPATPPQVPRQGGTFFRVRAVAEARGFPRAEAAGAEPAGAEPAAASDAAPQPDATALFQLGPHPELAHSVRGPVQRGGASAQLSGDVDAGELTLEESVNGTNISATWTGQVVDGSCGKEIHGTWNNATPPTTLPFVLRKQAGWQ